MSDEELKKPPGGENVIPHPATPTHTVLPVDLMAELMTSYGAKLTWLEANPMMLKIQQGAVGVVMDEDGTGFSRLTEPPKL